MSFFDESGFFVKAVVKFSTRQVLLSEGLSGWDDIGHTTIFKTILEIFMKPLIPIILGQFMTNDFLFVLLLASFYFDSCKQYRKIDFKKIYQNPLFVFVARELITAIFS